MAQIPVSGSPSWVNSSPNPNWNAKTFDNRAGRCRPVSQPRGCVSVAGI